MPVSGSLPPRVFGTFQHIPANHEESANFASVMSGQFPLPTGLHHNQDVRLWIGQQGDEFVIKYIFDPTFNQEWRFRLNEKRNTTVQGKEVEHQFSLLKGNDPNSTSLLKKVFTPNGIINVTFTFDDKGVKITKQVDHPDVHSTRYYKRVLPFLFDGAFVDVPEESHNWDAFVKADKDQPTIFFPGSVGPGIVNILEFYRDENGYYSRRTSGGKSVVFNFQLDTQSQSVIPGGKTVRFKYSYTGGKVNVLHMEAELIGGTGKMDLALTVNHTGIYAVYRKNNVEAKRFFRRVIPETVLGVYESNPDSEYFVAFSNAIRSPELLQKTRIELAENPDHTYVQRFTTGTDPTVDFPFTLGVPLERTMKGRTVDYTYRYLHGANPVLSTNYKERNNGPLKFEVTGVYRPDGYTATYTFGDKRASRTYTRISPGSTSASINSTVTPSH